MQNQQPAPPAYPLDTNARGKACGTFHTFREFFEQPAAFHEKWKAAALFHGGGAEERGVSIRLLFGCPEGALYNLPPCDILKASRHKGGSAMSEEKTVSKPRQLWDSAVKAVKGGGTEQLIETFTAEMTLVAEGLCEDQNNLRREITQVRTLAEKLETRVDNEQEVLDTTLRENQKEIDRRLDELSPPYECPGGQSSQAGRKTEAGKEPD